MPSRWPDATRVSEPSPNQQSMWLRQAVEPDSIGGHLKVAPARRTVTVFDVDIPPGVAFVRSLGRAGVPTEVYSADRRAAGRFSRYARDVRPCPPVRSTDEFVAWIADGLTEGWIDLIAPTSDYVVFAVGAVVEKIGVDAIMVGHPDPEAARTALFKDRFYAAFNRIGFPTPETTAPANVDEALADAEQMGYPVVLKPRCHAGIGTQRGVVVANAAALASSFRRWPLRRGNDTVLLQEPDLRMPLLQRYHDLGTVDVISVSGYLAQNGSVVALNHCRKLSQSPRRLGVGTMFEQVGAQPFSDAAVEAVREVIGTGIFELEVLVDKATGAHYAVDLNPRGFGQMTLDIGRGNDLPMFWYNDVAARSLPTRPAYRRPPEVWHDATGRYAEFAVRVARGPGRRAIARDAWDRLVRPSVGAMHEWGDPLPGVIFALSHLRHPRAFVRPFIMDSELRDVGIGRYVLEDPGHGGTE